MYTVSVCICNRTSCRQSTYTVWPLLSRKTFHSSLQRLSFLICISMADEIPEKQWKLNLSLKSFTKFNSFVMHLTDRLHWHIVHCDAHFSPAEPCFSLSLNQLFRVICACLHGVRSCLCCVELLFLWYLNDVMMSAWAYVVDVT